MRSDRSACGQETVQKSWDQSDLSGGRRRRGVVSVRERARGANDRLAATRLPYTSYILLSTYTQTFVPSKNTV